MNADAPYCDVLRAEMKAEARRVALARRATVDPAGKGDALAAVVLRDCPPPPDAIVSGFWPMGPEIDIRPLLAALESGAALSLQLEEANQVNPKAVLINTAKGQRIGYVPDWLCGDVHDLIKAGWSVTAAAEQVNPDAPAHVRVLCRIDAQCL